MEISAGVRSNLEQLGTEMVEAMEQAMYESGKHMQEEAKRVVPVRTGRLRDSIQSRSDATTAIVGTDVPYGKYVELGTRKMAAQPYLHPAAEKSAEFFKTSIVEKLRISAL